MGKSAATEPPPPIRCPYCGEEGKQIEVEGYKGFCNICGRSFAVPTRNKFDAPAGGN